MTFTNSESDMRADVRELETLCVGDGKALRSGQRPKSIMSPLS